MTPKTLSTLRYAVCAIGWIGTRWEEFYSDPKGGHFEIEGTGFLVGPTSVATCAHVVKDLNRIKQKRGTRPFAWAAQFVYSAAAADADISTAFRDFSVLHSDERIDMAALRLLGSPVKVSPVTVVPQRYVPTVGEAVGLCGYAHGSVLLRRGKETYRFGPVVQTGKIAALSPFDFAAPEAAILDLHTGEAASGSPVYRDTTGEVIGILIEGQIKQHAALSIARLVYLDASTGALTARLGRVEATRIGGEDRGPKPI